jgi:hypothetical protein
MKVQAGLPAGSSGRPGQRSDASTGAGRRSSARRWLASSICSGCAAGHRVSVLSTEPSTLLGR